MDGWWSVKRSPDRQGGTRFARRPAALSVTSRSGEQTESSCSGVIGLHERHSATATQISTMNDNRPRAARPEGIGKAGDSRVIKLDRGTLDRWRRSLALRRLRTRTDVTYSRAQGVVHLSPQKQGDKTLRCVSLDQDRKAIQGVSDSLNRVKPIV
jgi:hypothetical protein